jgi:DNA repair exonuclease SbcCD ATPase subunit
MMPFVVPEDLKGLELINRDINSRIVQDDIQRNIQWKPIRFEFSNMFSYGESNKIDFTKLNGLVGLFAPNAAGKSSLFDAVSFCLYDKSSRAFKASNILNNRKTEFDCTLYFQIDGVDYGIQRTAKTINKGKNVKVDVQFWRQDGDTKTSLNGTERRDTNQIIEQYVGKYEDFVLTALSLQGNNALFIDKSQSERKDLLAQFMGLTIFDKLYDTATEDIREVSVLIKNFKKTDFTTELAEKGKELIEKKSQLKSLETLLNNKNIEVTDLNDKIVGLSRELTPIDSNLDLPKLELNKTNLKTQIENLSKEYNTKENKIIECSTILTEVSHSLVNNKTFKVEEVDVDIENVYSKYISIKNEVSEAENSYQKLKYIEQTLNEKILHLEEHKYDPNCEFCCDNVFVKDAINAKDELIILKNKLNNSKNNVDSIQFKLNTLNGVDTQYSEYNELKNTYSKSKIVLEKTEVELDALKTKEQLLENQLNTINENINKYYENEDTISKNKQIETEISELNKTKNNIGNEISKLNKDITHLNGSISSISSFIEDIKQKMNDVKVLEEKNRLYTYYLDAVKRDGIPYELISKALPVIENEVNNILAQVVDFGITMEMDGKSINAKIVYDDQEWGLEMCSGMEKFVSGLAIRVALINVCNLPRPNFLVIDEGFGTLDSDNLSSLFMMMQYLKTQFDFIWIISHLEQMRDIVDGLIEIKKVDGFSKIDF